MPSTTLADVTTSESPSDASLRAGGASLRAVELACRRGERRLFSGLNLQLQPGRLIWLRADNGRGKTSLLRLLAGLAAPESGDVLLADRPVRKAAALGLRPVYIGHANGLKEDLSAAETLTFMARLHGRSTGQGGAAVPAALTRMGMASRIDAPVRTLSQGQRRRVALARLALEDAPLPWILDEPYDALDSAGIGALDGLLGEHLARGGSAILTSHQPLAATAPPAQTVWLGRHGVEERA